MHVPVIYRVNQAGYVIHVLVIAPQEYVNIYSTRRFLARRIASFLRDDSREREGERKRVNPRE